MTKSVKQLITVEKAARSAWYASHTDGIPRRPYTPTQRTLLRTLEKAKAAFVAATGAENFKAACRSAGYAPEFSPRVRSA